MKESKLEMNNQLTSSGKKVGQASGKQCVCSVQGSSSLPDTQFQHRAQGPPSQDLVENQEGSRRRGG